jgi:iron complex transport system ATP-binding protein
MSDRLVFMKEGKIEALGEVWETVTPDIIWKVYGLRAQIITNPVTELPLVVFYD